MKPRAKLVMPISILIALRAPSKIKNFLYNAHLKIRIYAIILVYLVKFLFGESCYAAGGMSIIRDSETENFLYDLTRPIFKAAGLNADNIKIYIINDNSLNAFVAGGQNVFINTGLITKYYKPETLIGVIAHESGHIAASHLARSSEEMKSIGNVMIVTYLAGIVAAIANPNAGMALIMGANQIGERLSMKYSRSQEEAADQLALEYLDQMHYSSAGLLELLEYFDREESSDESPVDEYARTHPVSKKRINFIKSRLTKHHYDNDKIDNKLTPRLARIIVKLEAFLYDPDKILRYYFDKNDALAKYSKTIAYFKKGQIKESLQELNDLIYTNPADGYLWELKGQILFESGSIMDSIIAYKKAVTLQKQNPALVKIALAGAVIALNSDDEDLTNFAINNLLEAKKVEQDDPGIFKSLATAYNQLGNKGRAYLALANFNLLNGDKEKTLKYAKLAKENLDKKDISSLMKAEDIITTTKTDKEKKTDKKKFNFIK